MIEETIQNSAREVLGQFLSSIVEERKLTLYRLEQLTGLQGIQIKSVLSGSTNYTIDSLLSTIQALDLYIFFSEKKGEHLNFEHMEKQRQKSDPNL